MEEAPPHMDGHSFGLGIAHACANRMDGQEASGQSTECTRRVQRVVARRGLPKAYVWRGALDHARKKQTRRRPPLQQQRLALTKATRACRAEKEACGSVGATSVGPRQAQTGQTLSRPGKPGLARGADSIRAGERRIVQGQGNTTSSRSPACRPSVPHRPRRSPKPQ